MKNILTQHEVLGLLGIVVKVSGYWGRDAISFSM
jgi:hypothetical protein